ncbi:MAG: indole-3-glycerol phosphate synthase TrpC [Sarcina sp.]
MILDKICENKSRELAKRKKEFPLENIKEKMRSAKLKKSNFNFKRELSKDGLTIIGEAKKGSPSKGIIKEDFDIREVVNNYNNNFNIGCLSILTEEKYFRGNLENLAIANELTQKPLLRKDFIIDEYQIYESKLYGADAILLIVAVLGNKLKEFYELAKSLSLDILVEVHDEFELQRALDCNAEIIGINNRNLKTFDVDIKNTKRLKDKIKNKDILIVAESGISFKEDIEYMRQIGVDAVLIGEYFMRGNEF